MPSEEPRPVPQAVAELRFERLHVQLPQCHRPVQGVQLIGNPGFAFFCLVHGRERLRGTAGDLAIKGDSQDQAADDPIISY